MKKKVLLSCIFVLNTSFLYSFDLGGLAKDIINDVSKSNSNNPSTTSSLSDSTVTKGLKEALKVGVDYAVKSLGADNGYLNNSLVKIALPNNLQKAETIIRKVGGDKVADNLIKSMNTAATNAAPKTAEIFINAITKMSLTNAKKILAGDKDAATQYFKSNTSDSLKKVIKPIIKKTMEQNSVAKYYDTFNSYYKEYGKSYVENSQVMGLAKNFGVDSYIPSSSDESLDDYVTNRAIEGLFKMIAKKESAIRSNPIEQTTSILKEVFKD